MDSGERTTGTHDERYNLISMLYSPLHIAEASARSSMNPSGRCRQPRRS